MKQSVKSKIKTAIVSNKLGCFLWEQCNDILCYRRNREYTSTEAIKALHNKKKGRRCFIVGNGPSLNINDLNKIEFEDSFAVNRIYKIFDKTRWRPTFYCSQDTGVLDEIKDDIEVILQNTEKAFLNNHVLKNGNISSEKICFFNLNCKKYGKRGPKFSLNPSKNIYEGFTVAYACIQLAVYMGYSEIYIIGTDHNYSMDTKIDGTVVKDNNVKNYMEGLEGKLCFSPQLDKSTLAFEKAKKICDSKNIKIFNATRGGKLEVFERVDFDKLF